MTHLNYLDDTYLYESEGTVRAVERDENGLFLILNETAAYPQGGGQPADKGHLTLDGQQVPLAFVGFRDGEVLHYIPDEALAHVAVGKRVKVEIDAAFRLRNAQLHSAGHIVAHVIERLDDRLVPIKGYHFPDGAYVEFINDQAIEVSELVGNAGRLIRDIVEAKTAIVASYSDAEHVKKIRPYLAGFIPQDKPTRIVAIADYVALPCGGTHLADFGQVGAIQITKVKRAKGNVRVSYQAPPIALTV